MDQEKAEKKSLGDGWARHGGERVDIISSLALCVNQEEEGEAEG